MSFVPTGLSSAWHNSGEFWVQTGMAVARHPLVVLVCAVVPAAERAYLLLESRPIPAWKQSLLEGLVTLWRVLLCVGMVWVAVSGERWRLLRAHFSGNASAQMALQRMGAYLGDHLHIVLWELFFFAAAFLLLNYLLVLMSRALIPADVLRTRDRRKAFVSVLRNLVLAPLALIYLVELLQLKVY
jgi:hypothetical protein